MRRFERQRSEELPLHVILPARPARSLDQQAEQIVAIIVVAEFLARLEFGRPRREKCDNGFGGRSER